MHRRLDQESPVTVLTALELLSASVPLPDAHAGSLARWLARPSRRVSPSAGCWAVRSTWSLLSLRGYVQPSPCSLRLSLLPPRVASRSASWSPGPQTHHLPVPAASSVKQPGGPTDLLGVGVSAPRRSQQAASQCLRASSPSAGRSGTWQWKPWQPAAAGAPLEAGRPSPGRRLGCREGSRGPDFLRTSF